MALHLHRLPNVTALYAFVAGLVPNQSAALQVVTSIIQEVAKAYPTTKSSCFHVKLVMFKIKGAVHRATKSLRKRKGLTQTGKPLRSPKTFMLIVQHGAHCS